MFEGCPQCLSTLVPRTIVGFGSLLPTLLILSFAVLLPTAFPHPPIFPFLLGVVLASPRALAAFGNSCMLPALVVVVGSPWLFLVHSRFLAASAGRTAGCFAYTGLLAAFVVLLASAVVPVHIGCIALLAALTASSGWP